MVDNNNKTFRNLDHIFLHFASEGAAGTQDDSKDRSSRLRILLSSNSAHHGAVVDAMVASQDMPYISQTTVLRHNHGRHGDVFVRPQ